MIEAAVREPHLGIGGLKGIPQKHAAAQVEGRPRNGSDLAKLRESGAHRQECIGIDDDLVVVDRRPGHAAQVVVVVRTQADRGRRIGDGPELEADRPNAVNR